MWSIFKKQKQTTPDEETAEINPEKEARNALNREKAEIIRQKAKLDLEAHRLELEVKKQELQMELERMKFEREIMQEERMQKWRDMVGDDGEDDESDTLDGALLKILSQAFIKGNQPQSVPATQPAPPINQTVALTHQQIKAQLDTLPQAYKDMAKKMSDDELRRFAIEQIPNLDAESVNRVVETVRTL